MKYNAGTCQLVVFVCNHACYTHCQYSDCYHMVCFHSYNTCVGAQKAQACLRRRVLVAGRLAFGLLGTRYVQTLLHWLAPQTVSPIGHTFAGSHLCGHPLVAILATQALQDSAPDTSSEDTPWLYLPQLQVSV